MISMRLATLALAAALAACAATGTRPEDAARVHSGMTEVQVTDILGPPTSRAQNGNIAVLTWNVDISFGGARTVAFRLLNGKVVERVPTGP